RLAVYGVGERGRPAAHQDGIPGWNPGHGRQRPQNADGALGQRYGCAAGRRPRWLDRGLRDRDDPDGPTARNYAIEIRAPPRVTGRGTNYLRPRPGDPGPGAHP